MIAIVIACVLVVVILIFELLRVINELEYINSRQTNAELTSATRWPVIRRLVAAVNHSLVQSRNLRAQQTQQEAQIHQLLTNLTHDIKTPLTVASGYVQLMQRDAPDSQRLVRIAHNLTAVNYYVRYLMDFDVVQEQSNKLDLAEINLTTLVQEQLFDVFDDLNEKHLQLKPSLGTNIKLISDASLITRILQNLIGNWLKYATENVRVSLREKDATHIELTLANQTAVPVENIDHLVERFYTNDVARSDSKGLGLSIVANLMTRLNGTLGLSVEDGWFTVTLVFRRTDH
ncbi:sensor histidine kinase [Lacticaseibacillus thailandensis]|uniref:histidine kinase n=1 Tax=Lacticaseibacillus thailandensis DSM 22698 = JCM 13996 TaxID=1423810 RepID=A0A0R2CJY5_9LACO|nr:HAMP domain-containing sensor histidine kinase [Lacticaseibacillus thailandensis]KRM88067.1 two component sensor transduction histidine kinase [Lacticaseibacillus thailandensis DSM 22698 = JCM 13996]